MSAIMRSLAPLMLLDKSALSRQTSKSRLSFLDLPPEIRLMIYELVFDGVEDDISIELNHKLGSFFERNWFKSPKQLTGRMALLQTCRQVHFETAGYVHGVVHAALTINCFRPRWSEHTLISGTLTRDLHAGIQQYANVLQHVTHLECNDQQVLWFLAAANPILMGYYIAITSGQLQSHSQEHWWQLWHSNRKIVQDHSDALISLYQEFVALRSSLRSLRSMTITWTDDWGPFLECNPPATALQHVQGGAYDITGQLGLAVALPSLSDIRTITGGVGSRYKHKLVGTPEAGWCEYYTGEDISM